jgi:hypothetical protein
VERVGKSEKVTTVSATQLSFRLSFYKVEKGGKCGHLCFFTKEKNEEQRVEQ